MPVPRVEAGVLGFQDPECGRRVQPIASGEFEPMTSTQVFRNRGKLVSKNFGRWELNGKDVTGHVDHLIRAEWARVRHFCGGTSIVALPLHRRKPLSS